jgi:hypothetical protein
VATRVRIPLGLQSKKAQVRGGFWPAAGGRQGRPSHVDPIFVTVCPCAEACAGVARAWELRVYLGRDPITGKPRYRSRTFRGSKRRANEALARLLTESRSGAEAPSTGQTFGGLVEQWFTSWSGEWSLSTMAETRRMIDTNLVGLAKVKLYSWWFGSWTGGGRVMPEATSRDRRSSPSIRSGVLGTGPYSLSERVLWFTGEVDKATSWSPRRARRWWRR